jgi:23S rRNA (uracil1939-C5)-methyltransferase
VGAALAAGSIVELAIERPVAGGRMLARHDGQIVLVAGAIPGEHVSARIERVGRGMAFAAVTEVIDAAPSRRPALDPACGGQVYAHIAYDEQAAIKRAVVLDALAHGGRVQWSGELPVHSSPERGYRMRARLHVRGGRVGFFREGTHEICAAATPAQLLEPAVAALEGLVASLPAPAVDALDSLELTENVAGDERAVHLVWRERTRIGPSWLGSVAAAEGLTGVSMADRHTGLPLTIAGASTVSDPVAALLPEAGGLDASLRLQRHAPSFFQANRYLLPALTTAVTRRVGEGPVVDLYAGVGLFAVSLAALGKGPVTAVEGDAVSGVDLSVNAGPLGEQLVVERQPVEEFVRRLRLPPAGTFIVDPPRTGMSRAALDGALAARASRLVYVSCDVATLVRDLRRMIDAGYTLTELEAFDLFPNTAHIESLAVLDRHGARQPAG